MKNKDLSKRISELESELEKLKQEMEQESLMFERFPVGSHICGLEIVIHDAGAFLPFGIKNKNETVWLTKIITETLANCHDWIEKYHPVLEALRENNESYASDPVMPLNIVAEKSGLWRNPTPIKKPWEYA